MMLNPLAFSFFDQHFDLLAPITLDYRYRDLNEKQISRDVRKFYFGDKVISYRNLKLHANVSVTMQTELSISFFSSSFTIA